MALHLCPLLSCQQLQQSGDDKTFRNSAKCSFRIIRHFVSNFFAEIISFGKFFPCNLDNVIGMAVRFGKDQCLGNFKSHLRLPPWEEILSGKISGKCSLNVFRISLIWFGFTTSSSKRLAE